MDKPLVSVIMPVFNSEKYLSQAIESILNQTFSDFEFLIFDDGSSDSSPIIIKHYAGLDSRIIAHYSKQNLGYVTHLNNGIKFAKGEFIARMDSDDVSMPDRLKVQKDFLDNHPSIGVVGSSTLRIDKDDMELGISGRQTSSSYLFWQTFFTNPFPHPTVMLRKSVFDFIEGYDIAKMPSEDYDLWTRIIDTWHFTNIVEALLKYREHPNSVSLRKREIQLKNSSESLITLWRKQLKIDISYDEVFFLKTFHKGYDDLSTKMAYPLFHKIVILKNAVRYKFVELDSQIHLDFFRRGLYLAAKSKSHSYFQAVLIISYLLIHYPKLLIRYFINGKI